MTKQDIKGLIGLIILIFIMWVVQPYDQTHNNTQVKYPTSCQ